MNPKEKLPDLFHSMSPKYGRTLVETEAEERERERNQGGKVEAKVKEKNESNQVDENK